ncbi:MAG: polysaccharide biosynthesis/export family protein [Myxococcaceae bacterium]
MHTHLARVFLPSLTAALLGLVGCQHAAPFVWVDDLRTTAPAGDELASESNIRPGDVINVRVFGQDAMSARTRVRRDGQISMPFLNDVVAAGFTPTRLAGQLQTRLKDYVNNPVVTVSLEEREPLQIAIVGEVTRAGTFPVPWGSGVLNVIAQAGGLTDYAQRDGVFVLRRAPGGGVQRIRFRYEALTQAQGNAVQFRLQAGDVVVVE